MVIATFRCIGSPIPSSDVSRLGAKFRLTAEVVYFLFNTLNKIDVNIAITKIVQQDREPYHNSHYDLFYNLPVFYFRYYLVSPRVFFDLSSPLPTRQLSPPELLATPSVEDPKLRDKGPVNMIDFREYLLLL